MQIGTIQVYLLKNIYINHLKFSYFSKVQGAQTQCSVLLKRKQILLNLNI